MSGQSPDGHRQSLQQDVLRPAGTMGGVCVGNGLAIPHAKSTAVEKLQLAALTLDPPLPCDTPDGQPLRDAVPHRCPRRGQRPACAGVGRAWQRCFWIPISAPVCARARRPRPSAAPLPGAKPRTTRPQPAADAHQRAGLPAAGCDGLPHRHCAHLPGGRGLTARPPRTRGLTIKVETNGAGGVGNELDRATRSQAADCIIVAVDRSISTGAVCGQAAGLQPRQGRPCATRMPCWKRPSDRQSIHLPRRPRLPHQRLEGAGPRIRTAT